MENFLSKFQKRYQERKKNGKFPKCSSLFGKSKLNQNLIPSIPPNEKPVVIDSNEAAVMVERPSPDVRLVLFKEVGVASDPKNMFDSKSIQKVQTTVHKSPATQHLHTSASTRRQEGPPLYQVVRKPSDWNVLCEMLFGSVGMAQKAPSLKIHYIRDPPQIMLSRVFCIQSETATPPPTTASLDRGIENHFEMQKTNTTSSRRKARTMPVPLPTNPVAPRVASSYTAGGFGRSDSSSSLSSLFGSYQGLLSNHTGSLGAAGMRQSNGINIKSQSAPKSQRNSFILHEKATDKMLSLRKTRMRIGFAVLCSPEPSNAQCFQEFFFEHFPLIESHMTILKEDIERAFEVESANAFTEAMMKALERFSLKLRLIYSTPRLPEPVWSTLSCKNLDIEQRNIVVNCFLGDITRLVTHEYNMRQKNSFISGLVTAVLTNHLGWVNSVTPYEGSCEDINNCCKDYNALWAQLGDLYGAVGSPTKVSRTIVTGSFHEIVSTILSILSYFIRSSRVDEVVNVPELLTPMSLGIAKPVGVNLSSVPCIELEDQDYVFVTLATEPPTKNMNISPSKSPQKPEVFRSKSSSSKDLNGDENKTILSRSYSGPGIKNNGQCENSKTSANKQCSIRHRTFSNEAVPPRKSIKSRRQSNDVTNNNACITPKLSTVSNHFLNACEDNSLQRSSSSLNAISVNVHGSFCMRQDSKKGNTDNNVDIDWPAEVQSNTRPARKLSTSLDDVATNVCVCTDTFAGRLQPKIEHLSHVQRASHPILTKSLTNSPVVSHKTLLKEKIENHKNLALTAKALTKTPSRSVSNPCVEAKKSFTPGHRRCKSGEKIRLASRRNNLPSVEQEDIESENIKNFQKSPLFRIPSVEMDHNDFDQYFDGTDEEAFLPQSKSFPVLHSSDTATLPVITESNKLISKASCDLGVYQNFVLPSTETNTSTAKIYPVLPSDKVHVPTPRKNSSNEAPKSPTSKIYPPLPSKGPVGLVKFNVGSQTVSFKASSKEDSPQHLNMVPLALPLNPGGTLPSGLPPSEPRPPKQKSEGCLSANLTELPLYELNNNNNVKSCNHNNVATGFATLMADYSPEYMNDFVLHGTHNHPDIHQRIMRDLTNTIRNPTLDEAVAEAICIHADTDSWTVKLYSTQRLQRPPLPAQSSKLVHNILQRIAQMHLMGVSSQFCLEHLENELRQLVLKSRMLAEYVRGKPVTVAELSAVLNIEKQDIPLLMAIASCHNAHVATIMI